MKLGRVRQQPNERLSYTVHYAGALPPGDELDFVVVCSDPRGLLIDPIARLPDRARFWVTGGVSGQPYKVTVVAATKQGQMYEDELFFAIHDA